MDCYDEWWLPRDMENMSYIFEYCDSYCKQLYGLEIDKNIFLNSFVTQTILTALLSPSLLFIVI